MRWDELMWLPPLLLAISMVIGAAGSEGRHEIARSIRTCFLWLSVMVVAVGVVIHVIARVFA